MYISPTDVENIYEGINSDVRFTRMLDQTQSDSRGYVPMKIHQASLDESYLAFVMPCQDLGLHLLHSILQQYRNTKRISQRIHFRRCHVLLL